MIKAEKKSPPSRWSGLKYNQLHDLRVILMSPPSRWSGLKFIICFKYRWCLWVSTLAVEWIEIRCKNPEHGCRRVSTLAVEWIEILSLIILYAQKGVSTLAVEWIEIWKVPRLPARLQCLHPRGGVD